MKREISRFDAVVLANLMDDCTDADGQWSGGDVCDALAELIDNFGGWKRCEEHGCYARNKTQCPHCDERRDFLLVVRVHAVSESAASQAWIDNDWQAEDELLYIIEDSPERRGLIFGAATYDSPSTTQPATTKRGQPS